MGEREGWKDRWSDRRRELGERCRQSELWRDVGGEFVVAAAEVLDQRVAGGDPRGRPDPFQPAHGPQPSLQSSMIAFDRVVLVWLRGVRRGRRGSSITRR